MSLKRSISNFEHHLTLLTPAFDTAQAHVAALNHSEGGQRFAISGGGWTYQDIVDALHSSKKIPQSIKDKVQKGEPGSGKSVVQNTLNSSLSVEKLGLKYKSLVEVIEASTASLLDYEERGYKGIPTEELIYSN